ncbi:MAG: integrase, partial [candidate division WOR-3 bacterium]
MDFYRQQGNIALTGRYFHIPRKTFYKWYQRYDPRNLLSLQNRSRFPLNKREPEITLIQEQ